MEEKKKEKGYKTTEQQTAATRRYLEAHPEAREKRRLSTYKSTGKAFIKNHATIEDLEEFETLIKERKNFLKNS